MLLQLRDIQAKLSDREKKNVPTNSGVYSSDQPMVMQPEILGVNQQESDAANQTWEQTSRHTNGNVAQQNPEGGKTDKLLDSTTKNGMFLISPTGEESTSCASERTVHLWSLQSCI